jgi:nicotinamidase-related amidase
MRDPRSGSSMPTELEALLRERGVERLVIAGLATDYCVRATVLDARSLRYPVTVLRAAIRAVDLAEGDGRRALEEMRAAGAELEDETSDGSGS